MGDVELAERELDVMSVLWNQGSGTVAEVQEALTDELAYTTVLTVLQTLERKGHVRHEKEGRAHRYFPEVGRDRARASALRKLTRRLFAGSPELLVSRLVEDEDLDREDLERISRLLDRRLRDLGSGPEDAADGEEEP